ncbi:putative rad21/Rec8-like protein [Helianthus annuus]|nr:putative rad21/Rec8-like protein [Helianthus annuus]
MFYSHNLLARKGPLGTVWCAAHLQNRLKKPNYISVNIPSTVEKIMNPEVPIALRMSGHLLFGVVRIYSKKVEYLQRDCNSLRIEISKAYANADINLPEDANQAKDESITLPDNFALDLMGIDDHDLNGSPDNHLRRNEDISFTDYSPASFSKNQHGTPAGYIMISVGEISSRSPSIIRNSPVPRSVRVEDIPDPHTPPSTFIGVQDPDPDHHLRSNDIITNEDDVVPPLEVETLRLNTPSVQKTPISDALPDEIAPDPEIVNEISEKNNNDSSNLNDIPDNGGPSSPPKQSSSRESMHSDHDHVQDSSARQASFKLVSTSPRVKRSAELAPAPPRVKRRRIKYDQATVLTNEFMKKAIDDASGLKRKRKGVSSYLGVYRLNNAHKKQKVLFDPVITGLCDNLSELHEDDNVSSKACLINVEQANPGVMEINVEQANPGVMEVNVEQASPGVMEVNVEQANPDAMEIGRFSDSADRGDNMIPINSPDNTQFSSPHHEDQNTPAFSTDVGSKSYQAATTAGTSVGPTPDHTSSIGSFPASSVKSFFSDTDTPFPESHQGFDNSGGLYDIPEVDDAEEFAFIEDDAGTPSLKGTPEIGSLLPRTRGVAKLIKEKSAATPSSSENFGPVSMKSILEGKTRKVCSRMFFETLVLKSCDLVDVKQDEPYGDITLKVTSKLSKLDFSN